MEPAPPDADPEEPPGPTALEARASEVARLLGLLAEADRLTILARLAEQREASLDALSGATGLAPAALARRLDPLVAAGLVATRGPAEALRCRLADARAARLIGVLREIGWLPRS